jgi:hypothetical protein
MRRAITAPEAIGRLRAFRMNEAQMSRRPTLLALVAVAHLAACAAPPKPTPAVVESEAARQAAAEGVETGASSAEAMARSEQVGAPDRE